MSKHVTHQIILIDTPTISGLLVAQVLQRLLGYSAGLAFKLVRDTEASPTGRAPCHTGSLLECCRLAKRIRESGVPCEVHPFAEEADE